MGKKCALILIVTLCRNVFEKILQQSPRSLKDMFFKQTYILNQKAYQRNHFYQRPFLRVQEGVIFLQVQEGVIFSNYDIEGHLEVVTFASAQKDKKVSRDRKYGDYFQTAFFKQTLKVEYNGAKTITKLGLYIKSIMLEGGIGVGNACKPTADSCQCMAKATTIL